MFKKVFVLGILTRWCTTLVQDCRSVILK